MMRIHAFFTAFALFFISGILLTPRTYANPSLDFLNRILKVTEGSIDKNYRRLSKGTRLLVDDPANDAIYEKLETLVRSLKKEIDNSRDVLSYYAFGQALLGNIIDALQRVRELIVEKSNTIFSEQDLGYLDSEISAQYDQVLFVLESAEFNRIRVFGTFFHDALISGLFGKEPYFELRTVDAMLEFMSGQRSYYGAKMNALEHRMKSQMTGRENAESFQSTILDTDYGAEASLLVKNQLLLLANILLLPMK
jgi:flagellin